MDRESDERGSKMHFLSLSLSEARVGERERERKDRPSSKGGGGRLFNLLTRRPSVFAQLFVRRAVAAALACCCLSCCCCRRTIRGNLSATAFHWRRKPGALLVPP